MLIAYTAVSICSMRLRFVHKYKSYTHTYIGIFTFLANFLLQKIS